MQSEDCSIFKNCLFYSANALARTITRIADEEFSITGLPSQYCYLLILVIEKPSVQPKELAEKLSLTPSTISRFLDKMEEQGYIIRAMDGKYTYITPTQKARKNLDNIRRAWENLYRRYIEVLGKEFADALTSSIYLSNKKLNEQAK